MEKLKKAGRIDKTSKALKRIRKPRLPAAPQRPRHLAATTRISPVPNGRGSRDPSAATLLLPRATYLNAPRTADDGPGESAGDTNAGLRVKPPTVGSSRRQRACEGVNAGAAGLSLVFVLVVTIGSAEESPSATSSAWVADVRYLSPAPLEKKRTRELMSKKTNF
jgi:hypothetical protein